jgi:hypothetical protein
VKKHKAKESNLRSNRKAPVQPPTPLLPGIAAPASSQGPRLPPRPILQTEESLLPEAQSRVPVFVGLAAVACVTVLATSGIVLYLLVARPGNRSEVVGTGNSASDDSTGPESARPPTDVSSPIDMRKRADAYRYGRGVKRDYARALSWYRKAAQAGDARAMGDVGVMYAQGWGVAKDPIEAAKWFRKGFAAGDGIAAFQLGWAYAKGKGVGKDETQASTCFRAAFARCTKDAATGDARAMNALGWLYENGKGVTKDLTEAFRWYRKGADLGSTCSGASVGMTMAGCRAGERIGIDSRWREKVSFGVSKRRKLDDNRRVRWPMSSGGDCMNPTDRLKKLRWQT